MHKLPLYFKPNGGLMRNFNLVSLIKNNISAGLFLLLLAPFIGELFSAHQPPLNFFNPVFFIMTALPYGFGAVIVRELMIRWGGGAIRFFLLALAYGLFEEGIVVRSFFNANWSELGALQGHDFAFGISWTFAFVLLHFHIAFSMWVSISLANMLYANKRNESWLSDKMLYLSILGLALWLPVGWFMTSYIPPLFHYIGVFVIFIGLILAAYKLPKVPSLKIVSQLKTHNLWFFALGVVNVIITYFIVFIGPEMGFLPPTSIAMAVLIVANAATFIFVGMWTDNFTRWSDQARLALTTGLLSIFFFISVANDFEEGFVGGSIVALIAGLFLFQLRKQIKQT